MSLLKIVKKGEGKPVTGTTPAAGKTSAKLLIVTKEFSIVMSESEPGTEFPMHKHGTEHVVIYQLAGKGEQKLEDGTRLSVGPGDIWHELPGLVHRFKNVGTEKAVQLHFFVPPRKSHLELAGLA